MRRVRNSNSPSEEKGTRPAISKEAREGQMIALAEKLAEKQLREGTASSQVITHYLKLGTERERKEIELMEMEKHVKAAKVESITAMTEIRKMFGEAMNAFKIYRGGDEEEEVDEDEDL